MIGKISEKPEIILGLKTIKKRKKISRVDSNLGKVVTAAVGFLAASQGLEGAAARPGAKLNGLAEPLAQRGVSNSRTLASAGSPPNNALAKSGVAPAPALTYDISTISEAPAPGVNNVVSGNGSRPMQTWIVNKSNVDLIATTSYNCFSDCSSNSTFIDHPIPQRTEDVDQYCQQHQFFNFTTEHLPSETNPWDCFVHLRFLSNFDGVRPTVLQAISR